MPPVYPDTSASFDPVDRLLALLEARSITSLSAATLYRLIERGDFPWPLKIGRAARWPIFVFAAFIESRKINRDTFRHWDKL